jgi:hypothetical protein
MLEELELVVKQQKMAMEKHEKKQKKKTRLVSEALVVLILQLMRLLLAKDKLSIEQVED